MMGDEEKNGGIDSAERRQPRAMRLIEIETGLVPRKLLRVAAELDAKFLRYQIRTYSSQSAWTAQGTWM